MTTNRTSHADCRHEATRSARAACRKARAAGTTDLHPLRTLRDELIAALQAKSPYTDEPNKWVFYGARAFANYTGDDLLLAGTAILMHFLPIDDATDANRRRNGYTVTDHIPTIVSTILRRAS